MELNLSIVSCPAPSDRRSKNDFPSPRILTKHPARIKIEPFCGFDRFAGGKAPSCAVKCASSSQDRGLKPKPKPRPALKPVAGDLNAELDFVNAQDYDNQGFYDQIEKLVFFKRYEEALELFEVLRFKAGIVVPASTYDSLIRACIGLESARAVKMVFRHMIDADFEFDQYMRNRVLMMHLKCGMMVDARQLFDDMPEKNLESWHTMVAGLVDGASYREAFDFFLLLWEEMPIISSHMFGTVLRACAGLGSASTALQLHSCALKLGMYDNIFVSCALVDMYSKCGCIEEAQWVFDEMPEKTTVGWNTIIAAYALHGYSEKALDLYYEMRQFNVKMDHFTYSIVLRICARLGSLEHARQAHAGLVRNGFGLDMVANTALVDLYCKWGRMEDARNVFDKMKRKNVISWNALIGGYAYRGLGFEAVNMFEKMVKERMVPNHVTFLAVLGACSYSGLLDKGREIFETMGRDPKTKPRAMHYACMIELFGREGLLDEAFALIKNAPFSPSTNMWAALLTACRIHKNIELGKFAVEKLFGMDPEKLSNYIVMLNIYNSCGKVSEAAKVLEALKRKGLQLLPACSWIDVKKHSHMFLFGDKSHPQSREIYQKLDDLIRDIRKLGYVPNEQNLLPDVGEHEQKTLCYHSEKLAIAFGLISTPELTTLQIVQGHRLCADCHSAIKLITVASKREIIVRDASRFHHFKDGSCSCKDYW